MAIDAMIPEIELLLRNFQLAEQEKFGLVRRERVLQRIVQLLFGADGTRQPGCHDDHEIGLALLE